MSIWTTDGWARVQKVVHASAYDYSDDFLSWLYLNHAIWQGFANKALMAHSGGHTIGVDAKVIYEDGEFWVLTPDHNPKKCLLKELKKHVGQFWVKRND